MKALNSTSYDENLVEAPDVPKPPDAQLDLSKLSEEVRTLIRTRQVEYPEGRAVVDTRRNQLSLDKFGPTVTTVWFIVPSTETESARYFNLTYLEKYGDKPSIEWHI